MGNRRKYTVVGIGSVLWDLLPSGKQLGGAPANFAYHAFSLGSEAFIVSAIGEDDPGREIIASVKELGMPVSQIAINRNYPTGTVGVELDDDGIPRFTIRTNVAYDYLEFTPELADLASKTDAVCFGTYDQRNATTHETVLKFLDATAKECLRVFDINFRPPFIDKTTIQTLLEQSHVLKLNDEELTTLTKMLSLGNNQKQIIEELLSRFDLRLIALTRGERGCLIFTQDGEWSHPGFVPERIVDTVGAGDAFTASLTLGLLEEDDIPTICETANRCAAYVCSRQGAMPPMPE